ncbi:hypothetical protein GBAR_LOCUS10035, partial [Geodia barretti]
KSRGKIWKCVVLAPVTSDPEADDVTVPTTSRPSRGKYTLVEGMETIMPATISQMKDEIKKMENRVGELVASAVSSAVSSAIRPLATQLRAVRML